MTRPLASEECAGKAGKGGKSALNTLLFLLSLLFPRGMRR